MEDKTIHCTQVCCQFSAYVLVRQRMFNVVKVPLSKILFLRMEQHVLIRIHCTALWQNKRRIPYEILVSIFFFQRNTDITWQCTFATSISSGGTVRFLNTPILSESV